MPLEVDPFRRRLFAISGPVRNTGFIHQDIGPDDLGSGVSKQAHELGIPFMVHILEDSEYAAFRVDGSDRALIINPHLGQIIADKIGAGHGRRGFSAPAGSRPRAPGNAAAGAFDSGDEHMFGELVAPVFIDRLIDREPVISLFHQQRVSRVSAVEAVGRLITAIHEYPCIGQIFGAVPAFAVNIRIKMLQTIDFFVKTGKYIPVEELCAVGDIGGAGDFQRGIGYGGPGGSADVKPHHHDLAAHDAGHFIPDVAKRILAEHFIGQGADQIAFVGDIECPVQNPSLLFLQIKMNGMVFHGQPGFFAFFKGQAPDKLPVRLRARIDKDRIRFTHGNGIGDFQQGRRILNLHDF